jgi:hypothetical protein
VRNFASFDITNKVPPAREINASERCKYPIVDGANELTHTKFDAPETHSIKFCVSIFRSVNSMIWPERRRQWGIAMSKDIGVPQ